MAEGAPFDQTSRREMGKETFLLLFVLGAGALAVWVALCLPRLAPRSFRGAWAHLAAAMVVGAVLGPVLHVVPGLPGKLSVLVALFGIALPAITYMLLTGMWLVQLAAGHSLAHRR
jgi:hypothetical protein